MIKNPSNSFQCWFCEKNLENSGYVIKDNFASCLNCYNEKYSEVCCQCQQIITIEMEGKIFQNKTWHQSCFNCSICHRNLYESKFAYKNEELYCRDCLIKKFALQCQRCNQSFESNQKCIEYEQKFYHTFCFVCNACQQLLTEKNFRRRDQYFFCLSCYGDLLAIYCIKCHKAILTNGIIYHNHPFHSECFLCTKCLNSIGNERYYEYENNAYCRKCSMKFILMKPAF